MTKAQRTLITCVSVLLPEVEEELAMTGKLTPALSDELERVTKILTRITEKI